MIVKIKKEEGWIFIANVKKAELQKKDKKLNEVYEIGVPGIVTCSEKDVNILNLYIKTSDYKEENYLINNEVYLLNDEGKTIERLN